MWLSMYKHKSPTHGLSNKQLLHKFIKHRIDMLKRVTQNYVSIGIKSWLKWINMI